MKNTPKTQFLQHRRTKRAIQFARTFIYTDILCDFFSKKLTGTNSTWSAITMGVAHFLLISISDYLHLCVTGGGRVDRTLYHVFLFKRMLRPRICCLRQRIWNIYVWHYYRDFVNYNVTVNL